MITVENGGWRGNVDMSELQLEKGAKELGIEFSLD